MIEILVIDKCNHSDIQFRYENKANDNSPNRRNPTVTTVASRKDKAQECQQCNRMVNRERSEASKTQVTPYFRGRAALEPQPDH